MNQNITVIILNCKKEKIIVIERNKSSIDGYLKTQSVSRIADYNLECF